MNLVKKVIKDWFTGLDGITYDPARALWFGGILMFLIFTGHDLYKNGKFDMVNFGVAYGSLLVAGGAGVRIKQDSEPADPSADYYRPREEPSKTDPPV